MAMLIIHEVAKAKGYNQSRLQIASKLNPSTINKYWNNRVRSVSLDALEAIAEALDVEVTDLIANVEDVQGRAIREDVKRLKESHAVQPPLIEETTAEAS